MLTIVVPMAGLGSRFAKAGFLLPKPLIPVHGVPMIRLVIETLRPAQPHRFVFIAQRAHDAAHGVADRLRAWAPGCEVILLDGLTEGAACTVLAAAAWFDSDAPLMIANSDQFVDTDINAYLADLPARRLDGLIMTMQADDPKWSFAAIDAAGMVTQIAEKQVISSHATVGLYNFARGRDFAAAARRMIARNERVNGEFYIAPVYNDLVAAGARIGVYDIGAEGRGMHGLGIPQDLARFLALPLSRRATEGLA